MSTGDDELERLRSLVGPSEIAYRTMRDDLDAAAERTKQLELAAGTLRGRLAEMSVQLARARQDQDRMQRRRELGPFAYAADLWREYWLEVLRPSLGRVRRRLGGGSVRRTRLRPRER